MRDFFEDLVLPICGILVFSAAIAIVACALVYPIVWYDCKTFSNVTSLPTKMAFGTCYAQVDGQWVDKGRVQPQRLPRK